MRLPQRLQAKVCLPIHLDQASRHTTNETAFEILIGIPLIRPGCTKSDLCPVSLPNASRMEIMVVVEASRTAQKERKQNQVL